MVKRIAHRTAARTVARDGLRIVQRQVHLQTVEETVALAQAEGVAVIVVVAQQTCRMAVRHGEVSRHLLCTAGKRQGVVGRHTRAEEVFHVVLGMVAQVNVMHRPRLEVGGVQRGTHRQLVVGQRADLRSPSVSLDGVAVHRGTVCVLYLRCQQRRVEGDVRCDVDVELALAAPLGGDHHDTVGSNRTVKGRCIGTLEDVDRLDVVGVDQRQRIGTLGHTGIRKAFTSHVALAAGIVGHRYTVDDNQRRAAAQNGFGTAENNLRRTAGTTGTRRNRQTGHLALKGIGNVRVLDLHEVFRLHFLRGVCQRLFLALDTHGRHDDLLQKAALFLQRHVDGVLAVDGNRLTDIADVREDELRIRGGVDGEVAVDVGDGTVRGTLDEDGGADQRFTGRIDDTARHFLVAVLLHGLYRGSSGVRPCIGTGGSQCQRKSKGSREIQMLLLCFLKDFHPV